MGRVHIRRSTNLESEAVRARAAQKEKPHRTRCREVKVGAGSDAVCPGGRGSWFQPNRTRQGPRPEFLIRAAQAETGDPGKCQPVSRARCSQTRRSSPIKNPCLQLAKREKKPVLNLKKPPVPASTQIAPACFTRPCPLQTEGRFQSYFINSGGSLAFRNPRLRLLFINHLRGLYRIGLRGGAPLGVSL